MVVSKRKSHESETTIHFGKRLRDDPRARSEYREITEKWRREANPVSDTTSKHKHEHAPTKNESKP